MWYVYVLYSLLGKKSYVGYTTDVERRLYEHNVSEQKGFTLRFRPWTLIRVEPYSMKSDAIKRERFLKTGHGREELKIYINDFLSKGGVSARAEKD